MGKPIYPTQKQIVALKKSAQLSLPESSEVKNRELTLTLPSYGLVVIEVK